AKGLLWPSESDEPIEAFAWPGGSGPPDEAALRKNVSIEEGAAVGEVTLAELTKTIPKESPRHFQPPPDGPGQQKGVTAFKVGEVNVAVYVVGRTADGQYAGIKTEAVET